MYPHIFYLLVSNLFIWFNLPFNSPFCVCSYYFTDLFKMQELYHPKGPNLETLILPDMKEHYP